MYGFLFLFVLLYWNSLRHNNQSTLFSLAFFVNFFFLFFYFSLPPRWLSRIIMKSWVHLCREKKNNVNQPHKLLFSVVLFCHTEFFFERSCVCVSVIHRNSTIPHIWQNEEFFIFRKISFAKPISNPCYFLFTIFVWLSNTNTHAHTSPPPTMTRWRRKKKKYINETDTRAVSRTRASETEKLKQKLCDRHMADRRTKAKKKKKKSNLHTASTARISLLSFFRGAATRSNCYFFSSLIFSNNFLSDVTRKSTRNEKKKINLFSPMNFFLYFSRKRNEENTNN